MTSFKNTILTILPGLLCTAVFSSLAAQADDKKSVHYSDSIKVLKFSKDLKIRGLEVKKGIYMGHAKVAGKYRLGVVVEGKRFSRSAH